MGLGKVEAHASVYNGDVIIPAVRLLELAHILGLLGEGDQNAREDFVRLHVHLAVAQEEVPGIDLHSTLACLSAQIPNRIHNST